MDINASASEMRKHVRFELPVDGVKNWVLSNSRLRERETGVLGAAVLFAEGYARVLFPVDTATRSCQSESRG